MVAHRGDDRRPKGNVGKRSFCERGTVSYVDGPTVIHARGLCLGDNLSTEAGGVIRSHALFDHVLAFESTNSICAAISQGI